MIGRIYRKIKTTFFKLLNWKTFNSTILYEVPRVYFKNKLYLGKHITINNNVFIHAAGEVYIDDNCVLSAGTTILSTGENLDLWIDRSGESDIHIDEKVVIGKNVWLCANTTICPGVQIADNCVIAAGSVVTKNLDKSCALYGGVPAKYIRDLN